MAWHCTGRSGRPTFENGRCIMLLSGQARPSGGQRAGQASAFVTAMMYYARARRIRVSYQIK